MSLSVVLRILYAFLFFFVSGNRVYTLIHVLAYRGMEKDYREKDPVSNHFDSFFMSISFGPNIPRMYDENGGFNTLTIIFFFVQDEEAMILENQNVNELVITDADLR